MTVEVEGDGIHSVLVLGLKSLRLEKKRNTINSLAASEIPRERWPRLSNHWSRSRLLLVDGARLHSPTASPPSLTPPSSSPSRSRAWWDTATPPKNHHYLVSINFLWFVLVVIALIICSLIWVWVVIPTLIVNMLPFVRATAQLHDSAFGSLVFQFVLFRFLEFLSLSLSLSRTPPTSAHPNPIPPPPKWTPTRRSVLFLVFFMIDFFV